MVVVKGKSPSALEQAYRAAIDLQPLVDQISSDENQAEIEQLLTRFQTVIQRDRMRPLDQSQP